jgi:hypothetical protein
LLRDLLNSLLQRSSLHISHGTTSYIVVYACRLPIFALPSVWTRSLTRLGSRPFCPSHSIPIYELLWSVLGRLCLDYLIHRPSALFRFSSGLELVAAKWPGPSFDRFWKTLAWTLVRQSCSSWLLLSPYYPHHRQIRCANQSLVYSCSIVLSIFDSIGNDELEFERRHPDTLRRRRGIRTTALGHDLKQFQHQLSP